ncbi:hypothetical protein BKA67DRAFT_301437 [Truncatella angustata]|uniref:F-box domain-containing protein n=1 Tax=Truncatella angustata TaxID=152316 RepID=A0A9P8UII1_9PEZI|nr:uncharacterized protein BKA67DRAFT_301437 [Truncatella angustata]KAH6652794.1 hypothetical protein BKA67DRAFT_301437 [Truncatella angustata]KAH8204703.1 hypothetical protein TruAng_001178 [Truncatella angustata]
MTNFLSLPRELRDQIYGLCLLREEPFDPWMGYDLRQELTIGLFRVSKTVHHETSSLFYTLNHFDFSTATPGEIALFITAIGTHSNYIRHIHINFPQFLHLEPGNVTLEDSHIGILANIQSGCTNLSTVTTSLWSSNAMELKLDALDYPKIVNEALKLADSHFRGIPSLQEIIVELYEDGPNDHIRRQMKSYGWTIRTTENVEEEEWDRNWSDAGFDDDYDDDYYHDSGDDYDPYEFDNDSDFWRRAGD